MNRRAASHNVPEELMLEFFLQQLQTSVQTILASIMPIAVGKVAEVADRILDVSTPNVSLWTNVIVSSNENRILQEMERLNRRIDDLTLRHRTPQRRSNSRPRNRFRNRSFSLSRKSDFCWYHNKFQERAKKCTSPCSYKRKNESSEEILPASIPERRQGNSMRQLTAANTSSINVYVASSSEAEHIQHFRLLFERLDQYGLSINPSKCTFGVPTLKFLGFQVCSTGIKPLEDRVEAILKFLQPTTITQFCCFLGMLNYYRRFIRQAAHILAPLVKFLKGIRNTKRPKRNIKIKPEEVLEWTDEATTSFELDIDAAQLVDDELKHLLEPNSTSVTLKQQYFPLEDITLTFDVSTYVSRSFIPKDYRKIVFQHLHGLSHPGIAAPTKIVTQRFVWPNIRRDIKAWIKC
ncbi:transposon Tf2-6 polyprotein [Nephila pilipes]|uniref:RNA-directed DNA polymerase n=1 Tax=Nephila pilipes TaxID=299642 RepID=A0A8X6TKP2_NEPPI|nr:transposon Tf2-6 polyprotein [Nephila pilipes]